MGCNHSDLIHAQVEEAKKEEEEERRPQEKRRPRSSERKNERKNKQKKKDEKKSKKASTSQGSSTEKLSFVRGKLDQIRTWISCGRRTIVQTISVDQSSSDIAATQSGSHGCTSSSENFAQDRSSVRYPASTKAHNVHAAQSDPLPGRKLIRPKAAKGERPKAKPHPAFSLPGVVQDGYDQDVTSPAASCSVRTTTLNTSSKVKKERPKAAKGQRTVNKVRPNTELTEKECLDAWMRRQLAKESQ